MSKRKPRISPPFNAGQAAIARYALTLAPLVIVRPVELQQAEWTGFSLADEEMAHSLLVSAASLPSVRRCSPAAYSTNIPRRRPMAT